MRSDGQVSKHDGVNGTGNQGCAVDGGRKAGDREFLDAGGQSAGKVVVDDVELGAGVEEDTDVDCRRGCLERG